MKHIQIILLALVFSLVACKHERVSPTQEGPTLMLAPSALTLRAGSGDTLTALLAGVGNREDRTLDWSSSDTSVVRLSKMLSPNQVVIAAGHPGNATVNVVWPVDVTVAAMATVTVY